MVCGSVCVCVCVCVFSHVHIHTVACIHSGFSMCFGVILCVYGFYFPCTYSSLSSVCIFLVVLSLMCTFALIFSLM